MTHYTQMVENTANTCSNDSRNDCSICFKSLHCKQINTINTFKKNTKYNFIIEYDTCKHRFHYNCVKDWCITSSHVIDYCILCNTVRNYSVYKVASLPLINKQIKKDKKKNIKCCICYIQ